MSKKRERDEYLEQLWYMKEKEDDSIESLKSNMNISYDPDVIGELVFEDMVELKEGEKKITLTEKGEDNFASSRTEAS